MIPPGRYRPYVFLTDAMSFTELLQNKASRRDPRSRLAAGGQLVEPCGIEPQTFWMQTRRSPS